MKVSSEMKEGRQAVLNIEMEPEEVEASLQQAYKRLVKKVRVPGFRSGKAPREVLERFAGRESLLQEAIGQLAPEACNKALEKEGLKSIAQPQIQVLTTEPLVFQSIIYLPPLVELGNYQEIRLAAEKVEVKQEDVDRVLENLRHRQALWEPVERPVKFGDLVSIDLDGKRGGMSFSNLKGYDYEVLEKKVHPAPGFPEQIVGMEKGKSKSFELNPSSSKEQEDAKPLSFKVKLLEVKEEKLPELNDDFARSLGENVNNLEELTDKIKEELKKRLEEEALQKLGEQILEIITRESRVEYPSILLEREVARLQEREARAFQGGRGGVEEYLKLAKKTGEEHREELRALAEKRLLRGLTVERIREVEKVELTDGEVEEEIEKRVKAATKADEVRNYYSRPEIKDFLKRELAARKTLERLVSIATQEQSIDKEEKEKNIDESQKNQAGDEN